MFIPLAFCVLSSLFLLGAEVSAPPSLAVPEAAKPPAYTEIADECSLELLTPTLAERITAKIKLPNGLEAYLISDPAAPLAGAALSVDVGSWSDPEAYPGMAHLLEHLLFMGSHTYPDKPEFMHYVTDHGGMANAGTYPDRTIYYYSIEAGAFKESFLRFSHFFIDPLLASTAKASELKVVDQEHAKNLENDMHRLMAVFQATGNPQHPFSRFHTGNSETLGKIPMSDLHTWFQTNYTPQAMHLIALSPLPLDEMKTLVMDLYQNLEARAPSRLQLPRELSSLEQRGHLIYLSPIEEKRDLTLVWELPPDFFHIKPAIELVAESLQRKGEGTLFEILKQEGLIVDLAAQVDQEGEGILLFALSARLTEKGVQAHDTLIAKIFSALNTLQVQGISPKLLEEKAWSERLSYAFQLRGHPLYLLQQAGYDLKDEPLATYPEKTLIPRGDELGSLRELFPWLSAQRAVYFLSAEPELLPVTLDKKEPWLGVPYAIHEITQERLATFAHAPIDPRLSALGPTPFLPNDVQLPFKIENGTPYQLARDEKGTLFLAPDIDFETPKFSAALKLTGSKNSARDTAFLDLYLLLLQDLCAPLCEQGDRAGMDTLLTSYRGSLFLQLSGWRGAAQGFLLALADRLNDVHPSQVEWERQVTRLLENYKNEERALPLMQALGRFGDLLNELPNAQERAAALGAATYAEFVTFAAKFARNAYIEGLFFGDIGPRESKVVWDAMKTRLGSHARFQPRLSSFAMPQEGPYLIRETTPLKGTGTLLLVDTGLHTAKRRAQQELLATVLKESFFDALRTKQQTSYIAKVWGKTTDDRLWLLFGVQSASHGGHELLARFELFIEDFLQNLSTTVPNERFQELKQSVAQTLNRPPTDEKEATWRLFTLAYQHDHDFDFEQACAEEAENLNLEEFYAFTHEVLHRKNGGRLALLIEGQEADHLLRYRTSSLDQFMPKLINH